MAAQPAIRGQILILLTRLVDARPLQRLGRALLVALGVTIVAFGRIRFIPGDPVVLMLGDMATEDSIRELRAQLGLDRSLPDQFLFILGHLAHGDLGTSIINGRPVLGFIELALPVTLRLLGVSFALAFLISMPLGVAAALYRRSWFGQVFRVTTSISLSTPTFFAGLIGILVFAITLRVAPVGGYAYDFPANLGYLWLPALINCVVIVPVLARVIQSSVSETLEQEFVETAIVRGLPLMVIGWRHLLRPSLAPTIGLMGYMLGQRLGASVVTEIVFNLPGIGTTLISSVTRRDYPMIQGIVLVFGLMVVLIGYVSEIASTWIDPRTKLS